MLTIERGQKESEGRAYTSLRDVARFLAGEIIQVSLVSCMMVGYYSGMEHLYPE